MEVDFLLFLARLSQPEESECSVGRYTNKIATISLTYW